MNQPYLLTIITVTYNAENEIKKTIESLLSQKIKNDVKIEYIVQDGCSLDNTIDIVQKCQWELNHKGIDLFIKHEKDNGIYDAMNKGIEHSQGKWICLLNAGDGFYDENSLSKLISYLKECNEDVVYSDYRRSNSYIKRNVVIPELNKLKETMIFCHQAVFIRDTVYKKEKYNTAYKLVADYDLMLRLYLGGYQFFHIKELLIDYDTEGISAKNMVETFKEIREVKIDNRVIRRGITECIKYECGILKRVLLGTIPQGIRWRIYSFIKGHKND